MGLNSLDDPVLPPGRPPDRAVTESLLWITFAAYLNFGVVDVKLAYGIKEGDGPNGQLP